MGNSLTYRHFLRGKLITLDPELFTEPRARVSCHLLSTSKLSHYLKSLVKPEVTDTLVNAITKGHKVRFGGLVKDKLKLRLKVIHPKTQLDMIKFVDPKCKVEDLTLQLAQTLKTTQANVSVVFRQVKLSWEDCLADYTASRSLALTIVIGQVRADVAPLASDQPWRMYGVGLNYEAECMSPWCSAYRQSVIIHKGYGCFQLKEATEERCLVCAKLVILKAYGVLSCHYTFKRSVDWDNTKKGLDYERLQTFKQMLEAPAITVFKLNMPYA
jgi:hypothetical protein